MPAMLIRATTLIVLLASAPAWAQAPATPVQVHYAAFVAGMEVINLDANLLVQPQTYRIQLSFRLVGMPATLFRADSLSTVDGKFQGFTAVPRTLLSTGHSSNTERVTQIDWRDGNPTVTRLEPPLEDVREPVPAPQQAHTIDPLSGMAALLHRVQTSGRCEGSLNTYDGRRLSVLDARTVGEEELELTSRSSFHGPALRCEVEGHMIGGFERDKDVESFRRPQHGTVWFGRLSPGGPPVPVRVTFQNRFIGEATLYVQQPN